MTGTARLLGVAVALAAASPPVVAPAQECPAEMQGAWTGVFPAAEGFRLRFEIRAGESGEYAAKISSGQGVEVVPVWRDGDHLRIQSARFPVAFHGRATQGDTRLAGFVQHGSHVTRVGLPLVEGAGTPTWATTWTPLGVPEEHLRLDLYIGDDGEGGLGGYFFFRDQRLPGLWGYGLRCADGRVELGEKNLGLWFEGPASAEILELTVTGPAGPAAIVFARMPPDRVPAQPDAPEMPPGAPEQVQFVGAAPPELDDGWHTASPADVGIDPGPIADLVRAVVDGELAYTHGVLIARRGRLAVEEYFYGFDREILHDMRSASKTVTSTLIGLAVQEGRIPGSEARALDFFPDYRRYDNWDPRKADITVGHLLTMSSGLDANDSDFESAASEGRYQSQTMRPDWIKLALDAPMIADPGAQPLYGGANPMILGGILANVIDESVEWFAHRTLFEPLGIDSYRFFLDPTGVVYMGGGLWMRPRDMAKFGQMYLDGGEWNGRRILREDWIRESWDRYGRLAPLDRNGHQYGYLWWHHQYQVGDETIETLEARGNGGQYIFVVPSLDMVVVITSGNFRNRKTREPEAILERYILPAALAD